MSILNKGATVYKIKGRATTQSEDSAGETLKVSGFDTSELKTINWNHKSKDNAEAYLGEPTKVDIQRDYMDFEGELYSEMPMTSSVVSLMKALKKRGKQLGISVEGKVMRRNAMNPKIIEACKLTALALTPNPVNSGTWAELIEKGETAQEWSFDNDTEVLMKSFDEDFQKSKSFNDLYDEDEDFKNFVIQKNKAVNKAVGVHDITDVDKAKLLKDYTEKAFTAAGNIGTSVESVEGGQDKLKKIISKSDVYEKIFDYFGRVEIEKAKQIFQFINKTANTMKTEITEETINKAFEILNLASSASDIKKSAEDDNKANAAVNGDDDDDDDDDEEEVEMEKAKKTAKKMIGEGKEKDEIVKCMCKSGLAKSKAESIYKGCVEEANANKEGGNMETLMKSIDKGNDLMKSMVETFDLKFAAVSDILKSQTAQLNSLEEINKSLSDEIGVLKEQPLKRKSVAGTKFIERFEKSEDGIRTFSLSSDTSRRALKQELMSLSGLNSGDESKFNRILVTAAQDLEIAKSISNQALLELNNNYKIQVIQ